MEFWQDVLSDRDRRVITASGHAARRGLGKKPAVIVIDAQEHFVGLRDDIFKSVEVYPTSVGQEAWDAVAQIKRIVEAARERNIPVLYSRSGVKEGEELFDSFGRKKVHDGQNSKPRATLDIPIVAEIAPQPGDVVIEKRYPSVFFGTPLPSFLNSLGVDTLILMGFTTSGCVRATCVDGMSYNYNIAVVGDACADRMQISHKVSLLDIHMKYSDVITTDEALDYMQQLAAPLASRGIA